MDADLEAWGSSRSRWQMDCARLEAGREGVIALQVAGGLRTAGARGHRAPGGRRLRSAGARGRCTPGDRFTAALWSAIFKARACGRGPYAGVRLQHSA